MHKRCGASVRGWAIGAGLLGVALLGMDGAALGQAVGGLGSGIRPVPTEAVVHPGLENLRKLARPIAVSFTDTTARDALQYIAEQTGAKLDIKWMSDRHASGLDPERTITLEAAPGTALDLLERVLDEVGDEADGATWQLDANGAVEVGPKSRLNVRRRVEIYDINDLLLDVPDFPEGPTIDLQQALQSQRGGGGQSPFRGGDEQQDQDRRTRQEKADELIDMITEMVEPNEWETSGGTGATIRFWRGSLIINGPDYIHRQVGGYRFWPRSRTLSSAQTPAGRRYVQLVPETGLTTLRDMAQQEVVALVGGRIIRSGPPGGGG